MYATRWDTERTPTPWQHRGRCIACAIKITGCRRLRACGCGGRVSYR